ncbi:hepatitis A virus cellular receptor 1 homolog [Synchiropus splendidus]|uniref:hepatitis A virus cellular receptor 1 homolog n=1 Tax=Synchiropus splendidus TaxID=270530 RepID=UPI00237E8066|nr:hepatitis A virus cellular receptor 1 homolog [Synchiropus splendidus]
MAASLLCCLLLLSGCWFHPATAFKVVEGGVASLSCQYSVKRFGLSRVCWGRSCGTFWCNNILVQMDESGVVTKESERYRLVGDVLDGEMDLDIIGVRRSDSGQYCCRIDIAGLFNDKKVIMNLRVIRGSVSARNITPSVTKPTLLQNASHMTSPTVLNVTATPSLHVELLLVSGVSLLFPLAALCVFLHKWRACDRYARSCCTCGEPRHILYEIRTRSRGQENIYTLD